MAQRSLSKPSSIEVIRPENFAWFKSWWKNNPVFCSYKTNLHYRNSYLLLLIFSHALRVIQARLHNLFATFWCLLRGIASRVHVRRDWLAEVTVNTQRKRFNSTVLRNKLIVGTVELAGFLSASSGSIAILHYWAIHHPFSFHGNEKSLENKQFLWFIQKTVWNAHTHAHAHIQTDAPVWTY